MKGSWHGAAVTEGYTAGTFPKAQPNVKWYAPIAPSGRELSPQVTEGASGRCISGLLWGWYLLITVDTLCRFYRLVLSNGHRKWDSFGEVPSLTIKLAVRPMAPSVLGLCPKPPPSRREV